MKHNTLWVLLLAATLFTACSEEEQPYPNMLTEMADVKTDERGYLSIMHTDAEEWLVIQNHVQTNYPSTLFRLLCSYTLIEDGKAELYGIQGVNVLHDSIPQQGELPYSIVSAWQSSRYINLRLKHRHQSAQHTFCYTTDSIIGQRSYLSIHHFHVQDGEAYTTDAYASIPLEELTTPFITINETYEFERQDSSTD